MALLTDAQIQTLASEINKKVNIPILGEKAEQSLIVFGIKIVLKEIEKHLPPEWQAYLDDVADGLIPGGDNDLQQAIENLVNQLNAKINIPVLGEKDEKELLTIVVTFIFNAMKKGNSLKTA